MLYRQGNQPERAIEDCSASLALAEAGPFLASYVTRGEVVEQVLIEIQETFESIDYERAGFSKHFLKRILTAFKLQSKSSGPQILSESLSDREMDVLLLLAAGLTNQQIAEKLFISLNTVKSHIKRINAKLDVHNRTQAVHRSRELGLI